MPSHPAERRIIASIGAHTSWANTPDRTARTAAARAAADARFLTAADGDPVRAEHLRKAFYARLALKSAQARRKRTDAGSRSAQKLRQAQAQRLAGESA